MSTLQVKKLNELAVLPSKGSSHAAAYDLCSTEDYTLMPMERKLFKTGLSFAIPQGMYGRIAPRSGLAYKDGIDVLAGVVDEDYRGEIGVVLINFGKTEKQFKVGDKIAQIIFEFYNDVDVVEVKDLFETVRGEGGWGSTGDQVRITPGSPTHKNDTITIKALPGAAKSAPPKKDYETHTDILEQWKKIGGTIGHPATYETLIKEREKHIGNQS